MGPRNEFRKTHPEYGESTGNRYPPGAAEAAANRGSCAAGRLDSGKRWREPTRKTTAAFLPA